MLGTLDTKLLPKVRLDDGRVLDSDFEMIDPLTLSHGDRVRVELGAGDTIRTLAPLLTAPEAVEVLVRAGVLSSAARADDGDTWPRTVLALLWNGEDGDATFTHDHHYLDEDQLATWARRSRIPADGLDGEDTQLVYALNRQLAAQDSPHRWYKLAVFDDERSAYVRLDRATASALGVGIFDAS